MHALRCPKLPEDGDDFEDENGYPETDNDRDGLLDEADRCPSDANDESTRPRVEFLLLPPEATSAASTAEMAAEATAVAP